MGLALPRSRWCTARVSYSTVEHCVSEIAAGNTAFQDSGSYRVTQNRLPENKNLLIKVHTYTRSLWRCCSESLLIRALDFFPDSIFLITLHNQISTTFVLLLIKSPIPFYPTCLSFVQNLQLFLFPPIYLCTCVFPSFVRNPFKFKLQRIILLLILPLYRFTNGRAAAFVI